MIELAEQLRKLPLEIKEQDIALMSHHRELERAERAKRKIERRLWAQICNENDIETGKQKFTNEKQREAEQEARLAFDVDYQQLIQEELLITQNMKLASIEREYLERQFKSTQYLVKLLTNE